MSHRRHHLFLATVLFAAATAAVGPASAQSAPNGQSAAPAAAAPAAPAPDGPTAPVVAPAPAAPSAAVAPAAPVASSGIVPPPPAGKGQVVFFRPFAFGGMALSFSVHEGATGIGKLGVGSYFVYVGDPGPHTFTIQSEATDSLNMEIEAGETYYVKQTLGMGIVMGRPHLTPADQAAFQAKSLKLSTTKATDLAPDDVKQTAAAPAPAK